MSRSNSPKELREYRRKLASTLRKRAIRKLPRRRKPLKECK